MIPFKEVFINETIYDISSKYFISILSDYQSFAFHQTATSTLTYFAGLCGGRGDVMVYNI
jgi:hypothetical protein